MRDAKREREEDMKDPTETKRQVVIGTNVSRNCELLVTAPKDERIGLYTS